MRFFVLPSTFTRTNIVRGVCVYTLGDTAAMLILGQFSLGQFSWLRMLGVACIGGGLYALEIPAYFAWIARKTALLQGWRNALAKTALAWLYFNPFWIARHLLFLKLLSRQAIDWTGLEALLHTAWWSFVGSIPISLAGNYVIQNVLPERHRFFGSAVFSGLTAIYYALSARLFA